MSGPVLGCLVTSSMWTFGLRLFISYLVQEINVTILYVYFIFVWWIIRLKFINFVVNAEVNIADVCGGIDLPNIMRKYEWLRLWNKSLAMGSLFDISQLKSRFSENCRKKAKKKIIKKRIHLSSERYILLNKSFIFDQ